MRRKLISALSLTLGRHSDRKSTSSIERFGRWHSSSLNPLDFDPAASEPTSLDAFENGLFAVLGSQIRVVAVHPPFATFWSPNFLADRRSKD